MRARAAVVRTCPINNHAGYNETYRRAVTMDQARSMFKRKAVELASKLQARFPAKLMFVLPAVEASDEAELFDAYVERVHRPYGDKLRVRDEDFFMTTSDIDDPMQMVQIVRGLWRDMQPADKEAVWQYMDMFARLARMADAPSARRD